MRLRSILLLVHFIIFSAVSTWAQTPAEPALLEPGKPVERSIMGGESHTYQITLAAGQFVRVVVEQKGLDAAVALVAPDGSQAGETNVTAIGAFESLSYEAAVSGNYRIVVRATAPAASAGAYQVRLEVSTSATAKDKQRIAAERSLADAFKSSQQGAAAVEPTIEKAKQALTLWRAVSDRYWESITLNLIGNASASARKYDEAIGYFDQALTIRREIKDRTGEGNTLGNLGNAYRLTNRYEKAVEYFDQSLAIRRELKDRAGEANTLSNLAFVNGSLDRSEKAIECYEQALAIYRDLRNRSGEGGMLNSLGITYHSLGRDEKAVEFYEQALTISRELKSRANEGLTLSNLGDAYVSVGRSEKAIEYLEQALAVSREIKNRPNEGLSLLNLGRALNSVGRSEKAIEYLEQALEVSREVKNRANEGLALNNLGTAYTAMSQYDRSLKYFEEALAISREVKNRTDEAIALNNIGLVHASQNQYEKAIEYYEQALAIFRELKILARQASPLSNIGNVHRSLNRYQKAIEYYEQALSATRGAKNRRGEGGPLNNLGLTYSDLGDYAKAIEYYEQALVIEREFKNRRDEAGTLNNLGSAYGSLNRPEKQIEYLEQSLAIKREIKDRGGEGGTLNNLGHAYGSLGRYDKEIEYYEQALEIHREVKNRTFEGNTLANIGFVYRNRRQHEKAITYFGQALAIFRELKNRAGEVTTLNNLGLVHRDLGGFEKATEYNEQALTIARELKVRPGEAVSLTNLMLDWRARKQPSLAVFFGKQAINVYQEIRDNIRSLDKESQRSFLRSKEDTYRSLADLLISQGRLPEAEQVIRMLKEGEYFDFIRRDATGAPEADKARLTSDEEALDKRYREIAEELAALATERGALLDKKSRTPDEEKRLAKLDADLVVAGNAFQKFLDQLSTALKGSTDVSGKVLQMRDSQGLMQDLRELGKGVVALYTLVGEDKYRIILTTPDFQKAYEYPIKAADLNRKVLEFRTVVQNPKLDPLPLAKELYKILIGPVAKDLKAVKAETLMWSLDGVLRYVPMAALHDGKQYLVESFRNVVFTPVSQARLKDTPTRQWNALGLGVTKSHGPSIPALPGVAEEMRGVIRESGAEIQNGVLPGTIKLDEAFTQEAMLAGLRLRPSVVHVASHFQFSPGNETRSALLLGDGTFLSLAQLKSLPNVFGGVELLTLSACNTATGGSGADGKEVEGFGVLAQRQGAKAVVASLWSVADRSTKVLMQDFYRLREAAGDATKAEALRQAQLRLLRGQSISKQEMPNGPVDRQLVHEDAPIAANKPVFTIDPTKPYAHPYYWAPFILIGNWK